MFIGVKMLLIDVVSIPVLASLAVVAAVIGVSIWLSLRRNAREGVPTARPVAGTRSS